MIAVFLAPIYIILCIYLGWRLIRWMRSCHDLFGRKGVQVLVLLVFVFAAASPLTAFLLPASPIRTALKQLGNYWLGILLYLLLVLVVAELLRLFLKKVSFPGKEKLFSRKGSAAAGIVCVLCLVLVSVYGILNARNIRTTDYTVKIEKDGGNLEKLHIVLVADLHLGYNTGSTMMAQMVNKINQQDPDLVVIDGDIFDNEFEAIPDPEKTAQTLRGIQSRYGVYACYGNHDIQEKILAGFTFEQEEKKVSDPQMDAFLEDAGIELLRDEGVLIENSFYLYGRPDYARPGRGITVRKTPEEITAQMDLSKPVIVIDHQPKELEELAQAGVDLDLCGHTHDGQVFPGNILVSLMWENSCGYLRKGEMHNIVTSGVGVFGPNMRVGTRSEICSIWVEFQ